MKRLPSTKLVVLVLIVFLSTTACGFLQTALGGSTPIVTSTQISVSTIEPETAAPTTTAVPVDPTTSVPEQDPTGAVTEPANIAGYTGFVVYLQEVKEFRLFDLDGNLKGRFSTPGVEYLSYQQVDIVGSNVYYYSQMDGQIYITNESGVVALFDQPARSPYAFRISADEKQIAWSTANWETEPVSSELWIGNLDGSNVRRIAAYNTDQSPAFLFIPLEFTGDGKLLFNRTPAGFGGYILYGGHNSLYSYDPVSEQLQTLVPAEELHGLCLDSYRLDLQRVVFNCGPEGSEIRVRSLVDFSEKSIAPLPDYLLTGSGRFSPSGDWLAYAAARGNPDQEGGKLLIVPGDLSAEPAAIAQEEGGHYYVINWLDGDTLLVSYNLITESTIRIIEMDGSGERDVTQGWYIGMTP